VPETVAVNCWVAPETSDVVAGDTVTEVTVEPGVGTTKVTETEAEELQF
jgi:molybdopterin-binding protein